MLDFHKYLMRHGEHWIQHIVEDIERREGLSSKTPASLEDRWAAAMQISSSPSHELAA